MEILLVLVTGILIIVSFLNGVKVGQSVSKGKEIEIKAPDLSKLNPIALYNEHKEKVKADKETKKIETILHNIDVYNGTGEGQKDIPNL